MTNKSELPPKNRHKSLKEIESEMETLRKQYLEGREFKNDTELSRALLAWRKAVDNLLRENAENRPEDSSLKKAFDALMEKYMSGKMSRQTFLSERSNLLNEPLADEERDPKKIN